MFKWIMTSELQGIQRMMKHNQRALFHTPLAGQYNAGTLENKPGCNAEQTLEALVNGELGRIRDMVGSTMSTGRNQGRRM